MGEVQAVDGSGPVVHKAFVTPADLLEEFIHLNSPYDPKEYIRCAVEGGNGSWLPMHYYARKAGLSTDELATFIMATQASMKRRQTYRDRAIGKISAFRKSGGQPEAIKAEIEAGTLPALSTPTDAANAGRAAAALTTKPPQALSEILGWMEKAADIIQDSNKTSWMSAIRRGLARIDELHFAEDGFDVGLP